MTSEAFERIRESLHSHGSSITNNRASHFTAQCPHHPDGRPSLSVDDKGDRVMMHCFAGCNTDDIVADLGLELSDLFDGEPDKDRAVPVRSYVYEALNGEPWFIKDRYFPKTFILRLPGTEPGDRRGIGNRAPVLYHAPRVHRAMRAGGCTVWLLDGEKDVETAERHGLVATCAPGGAGARWRTEYSDFLSQADEVVIVADQDMAKPDGSLGTGQQYAISARDGVRSVGVKCRIVAPGVGKDLTDHFTAGLGVDDFTIEQSAIIRPRGKTGADLLVTEFDPLVFCVEGILPVGLAILAGSPKAGKSWCALSVALAVSCGGLALSALRTTRGSVLYLAREDGYRRLQSRINLLMGGQLDPDTLKDLELVPTEEVWIGGEQGLAAMTEWAEEVRNPRLVVIDTIAKVEPDMGEERNRGVYAGNYSMAARYKRWADDNNCTVLMIHHDRKAKAESGDPFDRFSGSRGLTGAADTLLFLEHQRGEREGTLHITGRDVSEESLAMVKTGPIWNLQEVPNSTW